MDFVLEMFSPEGKDFTREGLLVDASLLNIIQMWAAFWLFSKINPNLENIDDYDARSFDYTILTQVFMIVVELILLGFGGLQMSFLFDGGLGALNTITNLIKLIEAYTQTPSISVIFVLADFVFNRAASVQRSIPNFEFSKKMKGVFSIMLILYHAGLTWFWGSRASYIGV